MERRKFLIGAGSAAIGSSALIGSGAFSNVTAGRTVSINVAGDSSALLSLDATGENSAYAEQTSNGEVKVAIDSSSTYSDASGVNPNADSEIYNIFEIKNQGTQPALVYVPPNSVTPTGVTNSDSGFYIDPQATDRPNGGDSTGRAGSEPYGDRVSLTGVYTDRPIDEYLNDVFSNDGGVDVLTLDTGESFSFGLVINSAGNGFDKDINMDIRADTTLVADDFNSGSN